MKFPILPLLTILGGMVLLNSNTHQPNAYQIARRSAISYLRMLPEKTTIVFDFDETLFHPHTVIDIEYSGTRDFWHSDRHPVHIYAPIHELIDVLQVASSLGHRIVLITARPDTPATRATINANFKRRGMRFDELYAAKEGSPSDFKARLRHRLNTKNPVSLTIGDQWGDVRSPGHAQWIKLPDKHDQGLHMSLPRV